MQRLILPILFGIAGLAVFLSLGSWQLQRLAWKQEVLAQIEARIGADPVALPVAPDPAADRFLPVRVTGERGPGVRILVSTRDAGAGYRLIEALTLDDGRRVLVDLGFQPVEAQSELGTGGRVAITGNLHWPDEVDRWTPRPDPDRRLWFARDVPAIAAFLETEEILVVARETDPGLASIRPLPVTTDAIPNDHLEYAVTWFLLAATWVVMTGFALWRIRRRQHESDET
jgi:surfeit locus 1 family protein